MTSRPRLQTLIFEVTQRCNHACRHCYNVWKGAEGDATHPSYPSGELDTRRTLALLAKALDESECHHVTLTGGEPLLREDLSHIVDLLAKRGIRSTVITNGRLLSEIRIVDLLQRGVGLFELPLLSYRREMHDALSGVEGAFEAVTAAMANVRYHRGEFVAVFVATRLNLADLYGTIQMAVALGARGLMLNRFNPGGRGRAHLVELLPTPEQMRQAFATADEASAEFGLSITCSIPIQPCLVDTDAFPNLSFGFCAVGTDQAYYTLDPVGHVRPCNHTPSVLGNLWQEPFGDLVARERLAGFVEAVPAFCGSCDLRERCQGGCKAAAQVCYGSLWAEEPFLHLNRLDAWCRDNRGSVG